MDLAALANCLTSPSCLVTQTTSGLIIGMLLFLVAAGLTLIFGVLKVVNFTHGSFYMLGAYFALTVYQVTGSYSLAVLGAALGVGLVRPRVRAPVHEPRLWRERADAAPGLLRLHPDPRRRGKDHLGRRVPVDGHADGHSRLPPFFIAGGVVPPFYLFLIGVTLRSAGAAG